MDPDDCDRDRADRRRSPGGLSKLGVIKYLAATLQTNLGGIESCVLGFVLVVLAYKYSHYLIASMTAHATAFYVPRGLVA